MAKDFNGKNVGKPFGAASIVPPVGGEIVSVAMDNGEVITGEVTKGDFETIARAMALPAPKLPTR